VAFVVSVATVFRIQMEVWSWVYVAAVATVFRTKRRA